MKLIDLLVQELPKSGGWPDGADYAIYFSHKRGVTFYDKDGMINKTGVNFIDCRFPDVRREKVSKYDFKSALAASQKPEWNGEGLPPVGSECEWLDANVGWLPVTIKYISKQIVVMASPTNLFGVQELTEIAKDIICDKPQFRPLRTEADKKREDICDAIYGALTKAERQRNRSDEAEAVYDAIAAGKIPGVKLED